MYDKIKKRVHRTSCDESVFMHCISEFLYLRIFSPRNNVIFHRTLIEKWTKLHDILIFLSSNTFLSKNKVFMEFELVYIRRAKYLLLCVYVLETFFNDSQHEDLDFLFSPFPRERKMLQKKKIALMIVSILNEDSR